jgi:hypothetical protein
MSLKEKTVLSNYARNRIHYLEMEKKELAAITKKLDDCRNSLQ